MTISFEDGLKILSMARQSVTGAKASQVEAPAERQSTISADQAHAFQLMMMVTNQNGDTIGKGFTGPHNAPLYDKHGKPVQVGGATKGTQQWSRPDGDYFNGQASGEDPRNPIAEPFNGAGGFTGEQSGATPSWVAPAPYGYTSDGRPKQTPGQTDEDARKKQIPISKYAPGREYGPTVNKLAPTKAASAAQSHDKRMN